MRGPVLPPPPAQPPRESHSLPPLLHPLDQLAAPLALLSRSRSRRRHSNPPPPHRPSDMAIIKHTYRALKNLGYSDTEVLVREATANDKGDPPLEILAEIARRTYQPEPFMELIPMLDRRLNDRTRQWRHVYRSLYLVLYILWEGSPAAVDYFHQNLYLVKTLREFQYTDDAGVDQGKMGTSILPFSEVFSLSPRRKPCRRNAHPCIIYLTYLICFEQCATRHTRSPVYCRATRPCAEPVMAVAMYSLCAAPHLCRPRAPSTSPTGLSRRRRTGRPNAMLLAAVSKPRAMRRPARPLRTRPTEWRARWRTDTSPPKRRHVLWPRSGKRKNLSVELWPERRPVSGRRSRPRMSSKLISWK